MNPLELSWAAGFFDGEGNIGYLKHKRSAGLRLTVGQADRFVLDRFKAAVGGVGSVLGPYALPAGRAGRPYYSYRAYGPVAQFVAACCLWPYLSPVKQEQIRVQLAKWKAVPIVPRRGRSPFNMRDLVIA